MYLKTLRIYKRTYWEFIREHIIFKKHYWEFIRELIIFEKHYWEFIREFIRGDIIFENIIENL